MTLSPSSITPAGQGHHAEAFRKSKNICFSLMFHNACCHSSRFCSCFTQRNFASCTSQRKDCGAGGWTQTFPQAVIRSSRSCSVLSCCMHLQVAEAAAESHQQSSEMAGKHEAALYATLAGHLSKILPVCQTRADFLWAHSRCWLEAQVDKQLAASQDQDDSGLHAALSVGLDAVGSTRHAQPEEEVHSIVLDDVSAFWPPSRCCSDDLLASIM